MKDVDVSYTLFESDELDGEISALLEVPDIDFGHLASGSSRPPSFDMPGSYRQLTFPGSPPFSSVTGSRLRRSSLEMGANSAGDGVVPDLGGSSSMFPSSKRQRT